MAASQRSVPAIAITPLAASEEVRSSSASPTSQPDTSNSSAGLSLQIPNSLLTPHSPAHSRSTSFDGSTIRDRGLSISSATTLQSTNSDRSLIKHIPSQEPPIYSDDPRNNIDFLAQLTGVQRVEGRMPFAFSQEQLSKLQDPKSLLVFYALGGTEGLEKGLRTNLNTGLSEREAELEDEVPFEQATCHKQARRRNGSYVSYASTVVAPPSPIVIREWRTVDVALPPRIVEELERVDEERGEPLPPPANQFCDRIRIFKDNRLPKRKSKTIFELMWDAYKDPFILVLTAAAVISLALGLYETFGTTHLPGEPASVDWVEGVAIVVAIVIVVVVSAGNDFQKERQFGKLNRKKEDRYVQVVRSGHIKDISVYDLLVGDIVKLNQGDLIPADGIIVECNEVKCDESAATGESDQMKKTAGKEVYDRLVANEGHIKGLEKLDPFVISGARVLEGTGSFVVTAVGVNSQYGKIMVSIQVEPEKTPLQVKLEGFAGAITKFGVGSAVLLLLVLTFEFIGNLPDNTASASAKASTFLDILIVAITIIVVAVPEGLPLAVTLALAYATTRMLKDNNLVRVLQSCETMGNATAVCSDKTGTLTQNKMTVVTGTIGADAKFSLLEEESMPIKAVLSSLSEQSKEILKVSVALNSTAIDAEGSGQFRGAKTETALLSLVGDNIGLGGPLSHVRSLYSVQQIFPFDSARKCMGIVVEKPTGTGYRLYVKGASEILLGKCTRFITGVTEEGAKGIPNTMELTPEKRKDFENTITSYARRSLRTIALVYKDYAQWPPVGVSILEESMNSATPKVKFEDIFSQMTLFAVVGIQDPLRPGVSEAVSKCHLAGVTVRMVTGDNIETAKAIARECGIYDDSEGSEHLVMEGPTFRKLDPEDMKKALQNLRVLARSSPEDKRILVKALKEQDEIVAVTGDGTNDAPALRTADVGFSMGIAGTEVAKEASAIILMDDNFSSIVKALMWGRAVNDAVQKFLQFQLTVNITAVSLTFVSAVASSDMKSVLTAVQLLWVNLIMDTFAALALATDAPTPAILDRKPTSRKEGLVTLRMWKMILGQSIFQLAITFTLHFGGAKIFGFTGSHEIAQLKTMVFNTFVWMQIFNEFNNRRLDNKNNIFEGIHRNYYFIGINVVMFAGQIAIIFVGGKAFGIVPLTGEQWAICLGIAVFSIPWAMVIRAIPDSWAQRVWDVVLRPVVVGVLGRGWNELVMVLSKVFRRQKKTTTAEAQV